MRRRTGRAALVEACAVERDTDGRPRPHRSGHPANFPACGNVAALQALAAAARQAGQECWCSPLARTAPVAGGRSVPGGRIVWADADTPEAVERARKVARTVPVRLAVESGGAGDPTERRLHLYLLADRWLDPDELEAANAALADRLGSDRVGDRGRLMRLPGTRNLKAGRPGRWCRILSGDLHTPGVELRRVLGDRALRPRPRPAPPANDTRPRLGATDALAPRAWFAALEPDRPINRYGYARCPLHDEEIPSLKLYDKPEDGWYGWGCGRGGLTSSSTPRGAGTADPPASFPAPSSGHSWRSSRCASACRRAHRWWPHEDTTARPARLQAAAHRCRRVSYPTH